MRALPTGVDFVWTEPPDGLGQARDTADPLGFRSSALGMARRLVPALTQTSHRTRGFSLICFGVDAGRRQPALPPSGVNDAYRRFERLVVYAQCSHFDMEGRLPGDIRYAGSRRAYARLSAASALDLNRPLLD